MHRRTGIGPVRQFRGDGEVHGTADLQGSADAAGTGASSVVSEDASGESHHRTTSRSRQRACRYTSALIVRLVLSHDDGRSGWIRGTTPHQKPGENQQDLGP